MRCKFFHTSTGNHQRRRFHSINQCVRVLEASSSENERFCVKKTGGGAKEVPAQVGSKLGAAAPPPASPVPAHLDQPSIHHTVLLRCWHAKFPPGQTLPLSYRWSLFITARVRGSRCYSGSLQVARCFFTIIGMICYTMGHAKPITSVSCVL